MDQWNVLRLKERIKRDLLAKDFSQFRALPGDIEEISASVKQLPLVPFIPVSSFTGSLVCSFHMAGCLGFAHADPYD